MMYLLRGAACVLSLISIFSQSTNGDNLRGRSRQSKEKESKACPCSDQRLCSPVSVPNRKEIFGFVPPRNWREEIDWTRVTSIAWPPPPQKDNWDLFCHAHSKNVRMIVGASVAIPFDKPHEDKALEEYVEKLVHLVVQNYYDGVTFDYEYPLNQGSVEEKTYTKAVALTRDALHKINPNYQISVCVPWSPNSIDGRQYDFKALSDASDYLYMMVYDTRSQIYWDRPQ